MTAPSDGARAEQWDGVYARLDESKVSWFEPHPTCSLEMLDAAGVTPDLSVIDVGAGASRLVDALLGHGFSDVTALDVSNDGLARARERLGTAAGRVRWVVADLLTWAPQRRYAVWHDRAVFHFLTDPADQALYRSLLDTALAPGARVVIGAFAQDGPQQCSGFRPRATPRLSSPTRSARLTTRREEHRTPSGAVQPFTWLALRRP